MASKLVPTDSLGGGGSLRAGLQDVAVNGLSRAIDGYLARRLPIASSNDLATVNADGQLRPAQAPQGPQSAASQVAGFVSNPIVVAVGVAAALAVIVALIIRR